VRNKEQEFVGVTLNLDPFLVFYRETDLANPIWRTEAVHQTLNPEWKPFNLRFDDFGGAAATVVVDCFDWDADGKNDLIGQFRAKLDEFTDGKSFELVSGSNKLGGK
jgi:Ca2+-dependent lipid-binding protein